MYSKCEKDIWFSLSNHFCIHGKARRSGTQNMGLPRPSPRKVWGDSQMPQHSLPPGPVLPSPPSRVRLNSQLRHADLWLLAARPCQHHSTVLFLQLLLKLNLRLLSAPLTSIPNILQTQQLATMSGYGSYGSGSY